ncbi:hypothetical protein BC628DRAFT_497430 [Trametes gibbosa]|nr:hypothetical protein BC628DRAFT_497430 [Trametes gibbosa]
MRPITAPCARLQSFYARAALVRGLPMGVDAVNHCEQMVTSALTSLCSSQISERRTYCQPEYTPSLDGQGRQRDDAPYAQFLEGASHAARRASVQHAVCRLQTLYLFVHLDAQVRRSGDAVSRRARTTRSHRLELLRGTDRPRWRRTGPDNRREGRPEVGQSRYGLIRCYVDSGLCTRLPCLPLTRCHCVIAQARGFGCC